MTVFVQAIRRRSAELGLLSALLRDRRGVSAVEFALLLPLMLTLYLAGAEVGQAITAYRKVSHTATVMGDLVSQVNALDTAGVNNIFDASKAIMSPFNAEEAKLVVGVAVWNEAAGAWRVTGSAARNAAKWAVNSAPPITPPESLKVDGQGVVIAKVEYTYQSAFSSILADIGGSSTIEMADVAFLRPRVSQSVTMP